MDYIRESITGNEKVLAIGRFHWIYYIGAVTWIIAGIAACTAIITMGVAWDVKSAISTTYPTLPDHMFWKGWAVVVKESGGYLNIIGNLNVILKMVAFGALLLGIGLFAHMMIIRATTEVAVTTSRLILKEGVIARNVDEMSIDRIESIHVLQSILGRILGYGTVMVRGMGIGEIVLPPIANPLAFRNALEKARQYDEQQGRG